MKKPLATLTKHNDVSIITLDDGKANVFSYDMLSALNECLNEVPKDSGSLVIAGREGIFSGGFDLKTLGSGDVDAIIKMVSLGYKTLLELYSFPRPIVAAVSGHSVALGIFVTCCADYRIAINGQYICQANEVRNNMDIPIQIMEIVKARVNKRFFYKAVLHGDPLSMQESIEAGYLDELASSKDFMNRVIEKAEDLATLGHPFYEKTKNVAQADTVKKINDALANYQRWH
jgi:enoyl-CoA hydratase